jgi:hypothetical protein
MGWMRSYACALAVLAFAFAAASPSAAQLSGFSTLNVEGVTLSAARR